MKLVTVFQRFNKSLIYNEYVNVTNNYEDYEKITRKQLLEEIISFYESNPQKIVDYCNEKELKLLEKIINNKIKKYEFDEVYRSLHSKFFVIPDENDKFIIPEELQSIMNIALKNIDYKKVRKRDVINNRIIGIMRLYGAVDISLLVGIYTCYYNEFDSDKECENYILNSFYLRHYIFIDGDFCQYNDYYYYLNDILKNIPVDLDYKIFSKEEIDSISVSKYNVDDKYIDAISKIFSENNIPLPFVDLFINYAKKTLDCNEPIELLESRFSMYLNLYNNTCDKHEETKRIIFVLINIPTIIYKGHSLFEMMNIVSKNEEIESTKRHAKKLSNNALIKKYKKIRKESIEALGLYEDYLDQHLDLVRRYKNLFDINKVGIEIESLLCHIITFFSIDDEEPGFYKFFRENITINNEHYEILNCIKNYNYSSLFLVENIDSKNGIIHLTDTRDNKSYEIADISLSKNKKLEGYYIYTSLFRVDDIYFTSGYIIPLIYDSYDELIRAFNIEKKRIRGCKSEDMKEVLAAYKLYIKNDKIEFTTINVV